MSDDPSAERIPHSTGLVVPDTSAEGAGGDVPTGHERQWYDYLLIDKKWPWRTLVAVVLLCLLVPPLLFSRTEADGWNQVSSYSVFLTGLLFIVGLPLARWVWFDQTEKSGLQGVMIAEQKATLAKIHTVVRGHDDLVRRTNLLVEGINTILHEQGELVKGMDEVIRKQGTIIGKICDVQEALAGLETREKIGVLQAHSFRAREGGDLDWALYVAADARAAVPVYAFADRSIREELTTALKESFLNIEKNIFSNVQELIERDSSNRPRIEILTEGMRTLIRDMRDHDENQDPAYMDALTELSRIYNDHKARWSRHRHEG